MASEYDITKAFAKIEEELMASMIRNMERHKAEESDEGIEWSMWQVEQLKALEKYKKENREKYGKEFESINLQIKELIRSSKEAGGMEQEIKILQAIKNGFKARRKNLEDTLTAEFFKLNERKLEALMKATTDDMKKAETAVLRMADDQYRKAIFNAQVYANTGAGTYEKAVDMATKDMLSKGLNCVEYANGARHTLKDYADMAIRTASKRAYLQGEGEKRQEWGISTVIMNKRGNPCPKCLPFCGKVLIDDVWSGGSKEDGPYPLMSKAIAAGLYHPRCKDSHTTYFPGISTPPDGTYTKDEIKQIEEESEQEAKQQYAVRQAEKFGRLARYSLDDDNSEQYQRREKMWKHVAFRTGNMDADQYAEEKRSLANFHATPREQVVNILRQDSKMWIDKLSKEEKWSLRKYTYNSGDKRSLRFFERLNAMLRGEMEQQPEIMKHVDIISGALKKNRLQRDIICYRNMDINPYVDYSVGDILREPQFISTSVVAGKALDKAFRVTIYAPKGSRGAYIELLSKYPNQRELLLDKDCLFRVVSKQEDGIELEVIP